MLRRIEHAVAALVAVVATAASRLAPPPDPHGHAGSFRFGHSGWKTPVGLLHLPHRCGRSSHSPSNSPSRPSGTP
ncbi:acyl-CoA carboxylase epsilon subunit [Leucobacter sp. HNU]|uniref:acyl-CoA carboxylase epsilon subunit n=1 Tax=Leucobacter sp. HNU TaxID=3236805 RepID=UPI003A8025A1